MGIWRSFARNIRRRAVIETARTSRETLLRIEIRAEGHLRWNHGRGAQVTKKCRQKKVGGPPPHANQSGNGWTNNEVPAEKGSRKDV